MFTILVLFCQLEQMTPWESSVEVQFKASLDDAQPGELAQDGNKPIPDCSWTQTNKGDIRRILLRHTYTHVLR